MPYDKDLVRPDAYVLFYRHRNLPVHLNIKEPPASPTSMDTYEDTVPMESSSMKDIHEFVH